MLPDQNKGGSKFLTRWRPHLAMTAAGARHASDNEKPTSSAKKLSLGLPASNDIKSKGAAAAEAPQVTRYLSVTKRDMK